MNTVKTLAIICLQLLIWNPLSFAQSTRSTLAPKHITSDLGTFLSSAKPLKAQENLNSQTKRQSLTNLSFGYPQPDNSYRRFLRDQFTNNKPLATLTYILIAIVPSSLVAIFMFAPATTLSITLISVSLVTLYSIVTFHQYHAFIHQNFNDVQSFMSRLNYLEHYGLHAYRKILLNSWHQEHSREHQRYFKRAHWDPQRGNYVSQMSKAESPKIIPEKTLEEFRILKKQAVLEQMLGVNPNNGKVLMPSTFDRLVSERPGVAWWVQMIAPDSKVPKNQTFKETPTVISVSKRNEQFQHYLLSLGLPYELLNTRLAYPSEKALEYYRQYKEEILNYFQNTAKNPLAIRDSSKKIAYFEFLKRFDLATVPLVIAKRTLNPMQAHKKIYPQRYIGQINQPTSDAVLFFRSEQGLKIPMAKRKVSLGFSPEASNKALYKASPKDVIAHLKFVEVPVLPGGMGKDKALDEVREEILHHRYRLDKAGKAELEKAAKQLENSAKAKHSQSYLAFLRRSLGDGFLGIYDGDDTPPKQISNLVDRLYESLHRKHGRRSQTEQNKWKDMLNSDALQRIAENIPNFGDDRTGVELNSGQVDSRIFNDTSYAKLFEKELQAGSDASGAHMYSLAELVQDFRTHGHWSAHDAMIALSLYEHIAHKRLDLSKESTQSLKDIGNFFEYVGFELPPKHIDRDGLFSPLRSRIQRSA